MATVHKHRDRWQVQVRRKGHVPVSKSFILKSDALEWARYMEQRADRKTLPYDPRRLDSITRYRLIRLPWSRSRNQKQVGIAAMR